jgi:hypothetical protein
VRQHGGTREFHANGNEGTGKKKSVDAEHLRG